MISLVKDLQGGMEMPLEALACAAGTTDLTYIHLNSDIFIQKVMIQGTRHSIKHIDLKESKILQEKPG